MREKGMLLAILPLFFMGLASCQTRHTVELAPVEIKPIHITIDVNVRVDRALDNFFGDIDNTGKGIQGSKEGKK
ncbi:MAG: hypothetical protein V2B19_17825 [Pseudomonadota bacterium]